MGFQKFAFINAVALISEVCCNEHNHNIYHRFRGDSFVKTKNPNKLESLKATPVRNYHQVIHSLTGVTCRANSLAKSHGASTFLWLIHVLSAAVLALEVLSALCAH